jgi:hypothetical protein
MRKPWPYAVAAWVALSPALTAWGPTGHRVVSRVAVATLPDDVPAFVKRQIDWIGERAITPDSYRAASEPFIKMAEDPSHQWHLERVAFLREIPRSRVEFVLAVYDERQRLLPTDPAAAAAMNVAGTGLLPYTTVEVYERLKATFRTWRDQQKAKQPATFTELDAAFYIGWLSHYVADAAQPLHASVHHDGWVGAENPRGYTREGAIHWGFENDFVDLIGLGEKDIQSKVGAARVVADPFTAILGHLQRAHTRLEQVYQLEQAKAFGDAKNTVARELAYACIADAAAMLRDLVYTAWVSSAEPAAPRTGILLPNDPANPRYNPATGTAPAATPH